MKSLINKNKSGESLRQWIDELKENIWNTNLNHEEFDKNLELCKFKLRKKFKKGKKVEIEFEGEFINSVNKKETKEYFIRISLNELPDGSMYFMIQFTDINERMKTHEAIIADKIKTMMFCSISHELRTPLNQIKGTVYLSMKENDIVKIHKYMKIADRASWMLLHKIDDILDFYEIESKKFITKFECLYVDNFLQEIDELMRPQIEEKGLFFTIHIAKNFKVKITFDKERVRRVLLNILNNAIKYTQSGFITLIVSKELRNSIKFSISDTGWGISQEKQKTLFTLFGKFKESGNSAVKLGGLGLSISQMLLKSLGSELKCSSTVNIGTKFYFEIEISEPLPEIRKSSLSKNYRLVFKQI